LKSLILFNAETGLLEKRLERAALEGEGWWPASTSWVAPAKGRAEWLYSPCARPLISTRFLRDQLG